MKRIPISAAKAIAKEYGYDQVVVYARKVGDQGGEHMTTYGVNREHCSVAARIGTTLKKFMGWNVEEDSDPICEPPDTDRPGSAVVAPGADP